MSAYPFSAVPGIAMTESPISSNPPTNEISVGYSKVSSQYSLPSSTRSAKESSPYFFNNTWDRLPPPCQNRVRIAHLVAEPERVALLTCMPVASSSKPTARTMVRVGLKSFSSKVSTDELLGIDLISAVGEDRIPHTVFQSIHSCHRCFLFPR